jgi:hypothetical protein
MSDFSTRPLVLSKTMVPVALVLFRSAPLILNGSGLVPLSFGGVY